MNHAVRIKKTSAGMTLYLNAETEFEELISEIHKKFGESAQFFGNVQTILSLEGRELTAEEEARIVDTITEVTALDIVYLFDKKSKIEAEPEQEERKSDIQPVAEHCEEEGTVFYKRNIVSGEMLRADKDMVIFGNVSQGAVLVSTNSIYVFGGLYGEAYAGVDNGNDYVIAAMDFMPEKVGIGRMEYEGKKVSKWKKKTGFEPQIAYVRKNKIVTEQITKELLNSLA